MKTTLLFLTLFFSALAQATVYTGKCFIHNGEAPSVVIDTELVGGSRKWVGLTAASSVFLEVRDGAAASVDLMILEIKDWKESKVMKTTIQAQTTVLTYTLNSTENIPQDIACELRRMN